MSAAIGTTVTVVDGPPLSWDSIQAPADAVSETQFLFVGASLDGDSAAGDQDFNAAGAVSRDEQAGLSCTAYVTGGDPDVQARRNEAFAIVGAVENALRADPSLAGAVLFSRVSGISRVAMRQTPDGADCLVEFVVAFRAYLS